MTNIPSISGKQLIRIRRRFGFEVIWEKGSHHFLRHADGRSTVVPIHRNEMLGPGLLHKILKDCELTVSDITRGH